MRFSFFTLLGCSSLLLIGCSSSVPQSDAPAKGWISYEHKASGVAVRHPDDWTVSEPQEGMIAFASPGDEVNITLAIQVSPQPGMGLDEYTSYYKGAVGPTLSDRGLTFTLLDSRAARLGVLPAHEMQFLLEGENTAKGRTVWAISKGNVYTLTYSSTEHVFDQWNPVMDEMMRTIEL